MTTLDSISLLGNPPSTTVSEDGPDTSEVSEDFDAFLKLFMTQVQNQDPTEPMETNEMSSIIAQFTSVNEAVKTNSHLEDLVESNKTSQETTVANSQITLASGQIGKNVEYEGNLLNLGESGNVSMSYDLGEDARGSEIAIYDAKGVPVAVFEGQKTQGTHRVTWDGTGSDGERLPPGPYSVEVTSIDAKNNKSTAKLFVEGKVTGVDLSGEEITFIVNDNLSVGMGAIRSLTENQS